MTRTELRSFLEKRKSTQEKAASDLGISSRQLRRWLTGQTPIPKWVHLVIKSLENHKVESDNA